MTRAMLMVDPASRQRNTIREMSGYRTISLRRTANFVVGIECRLLKTRALEGFFGSTKRRMRRTQILARRCSPAHRDQQLKASGGCRYRRAQIHSPSTGKAAVMDRDAVLTVEADTSHPPRRGSGWDPSGSRTSSPSPSLAAAMTTSVSFACPPHTLGSNSADSADVPRHRSYDVATQFSFLTASRTRRP